MSVARFIDMVKESYVSVMGIGKWNSLTDAQKHDVIMIFVEQLVAAMS